MKKLRLNRIWSIPSLTADFPTVMAFILCVFSLIILNTLISTDLHIELRPHIVVLSGIVIAFPFASSYMKRAYGLLEPIVMNIIDNISQPTSKNLVRENHKWAYQSLLSYIIPIFFAVFGFTTMTKMTGLPWLAIPIAAVGYQLLLSVFLLLSGSLGWQFFCFVVFLYKLSKVELQGIEPFQSPKQELKKLHEVVISVVVLGIMVYLSAIVAIWLVPWGKTLLFYNPFGYFWAFPLAIAVILYFFVAEYFIHSLLQNIKDLRLQKIDDLLKTVYGKWFYEKWLADSPGNSVGMFGELIKWREIINQESTWAINFQIGLTIITSILLPAAGTIIDLISR